MKQIACLFFLLIVYQVNLTWSQENNSATFYFNTAQSELPTSEKAKLSRFILENREKLDSISIVGFCDDRGRSSYNDSLSSKRALTIKNELIKSGIKSETIVSTSGKGEIQLTSSTAIFSQRKNNRRAEIRFIENSTMKVEEKPIQVKQLFSDTIKVGDKITLENILFEGGRRVLLPESFPALENLVATLKSRSNLSIMILGHVCCSNHGEDGIDWDTGNRNLSGIRARTIYDYLIDHGISKDRLQFKGMKGEFKTGLGDKFDRRVEVEITSVDFGK